MTSESTSSQVAQKYQIVYQPGKSIALSQFTRWIYGKVYPEFWVQTPIDGQPATVGNGTHIGFIAPTKEAVRAFYEAAIASGGID